MAKEPLFQQLKYLHLQSFQATSPFTNIASFLGHFSFCPHLLLLLLFCYCYYWPFLIQWIHFNYLLQNTTHLPGKRDSSFCLKKGLISNTANKKQEGRGGNRRWKNKRNELERWKEGALERQRQPWFLSDWQVSGRWYVSNNCQVEPGKLLIDFNEPLFTFAYLLRVIARQLWATLFWVHL